MKTKLIFISMLMLVSSGLWAQEQNARPERPKMKTPEERAEAKAGLMREEVGLNDKQYKKVYKLFLKDFQYRQSLAEEAFANKMPPQGGPGMGGPGMGPGGPGMGSGMGRPEGFPEGRPNGERPAQGDVKEGGRPGPRPDGVNPMDSLVSEEYLEKQETKLKKILTEDQYVMWCQKHPAEQNQLPPLELKK